MNHPTKKAYEPQKNAEYEAAWKKYADLRQKVIDDPDDKKSKLAKLDAFTEVRKIERRLAHEGTIVSEGKVVTQPGGPQTMQPRGEATEDSMEKGVHRKHPTHA